MRPGHFTHELAAEQTSLKTFWWKYSISGLGLKARMDYDKVPHFGLLAYAFISQPTTIPNNNDRLHYPLPVLPDLRYVKQYETVYSTLRYCRKTLHRPHICIDQLLCHRIMLVKTNLVYQLNFAKITVK